MVLSTGPYKKCVYDDPITKLYCFTRIKVNLFWKKPNSLQGNTTVYISTTTTTTKISRQFCKRVYVSFRAIFFLFYFSILSHTHTPPGQIECDAYYYAPYVCSVTFCRLCFFFVCIVFDLCQQKGRQWVRTRNDILCSGVITTTTQFLIFESDLYDRIEFDGLCLWGIQNKRKLFNIWRMSRNVYKISKRLNKTIYNITLAFSFR